MYNGDADPGLNSFYAQNWTAALGYAEKEGWRPWTLDGKQAVGGYVTRYAHDFDFLTIRGAGHMVPEYQVCVRSWSPWIISMMMRMGRELLLRCLLLTPSSCIVCSCA